MKTLHKILAVAAILTVAAGFQACEKKNPPRNSAAAWNYSWARLTSMNRS